MNLKHLFELQAKLDDHIEKEHPRQPGEDRLAKKILALQVELGELANELPEVFKFWSNKKNNYEKALEELVDCLHFILSIGLDLRMDEVVDELDFKYASGKDTLGCFVDLYSDTTNLYYVRENDDMNSYFFEYIVSKFIRLGEILGFNCEQVEQAYLQKNAVNYERQESGY